MAEGLSGHICMLQRNNYLWPVRSYKLVKMLLSETVKHFVLEICISKDWLFTLLLSCLWALFQGDFAFAFLILLSCFSPLQAHECGIVCVCVRVPQTDKCDWAQKILKFCILFYILISFLFLIFMGAKFDMFESDVEQTQYYMSLKHCRCKWVIKYLWIINIKWGLFMFNVDCWR